MNIELSERPFLAAGTSPFRCKGTSYVGHMQWVSEHFPGGRDGYLAQFDHDPKLKEFHSQPFMPPAWYDFTPLACAGFTCARAMKMPFEEFIAYRARYQAKLDLGGVYKLLLQITPSTLIAKKLARILAQYFDFGEPVAIEDRKGYVKCEVQGLPLVFVPWFRACFNGFVETVLTTSGAKNVRVVTAHTASGFLRDFPAATMALEIHWA